MSCFSITAELLCGLLACIAKAAPAAEGAPSSTNIEELVSTGSPLFRSHARFRLTGVLLDNRLSPSFFCDGRAIVLFYASGNERTDVRAGDVVVVEGTSHNGEYEVQSLSVLGKTDIPKPTAVSPVDVQKGRCANMFVVTQGRVTDVFKDDIDANFLYLLISADGATACASIVVQRNVEALAQKLLGAEVRVCGVCMPPITFQRPYAGCIIRLLDASSLETVNPAVTDPLSFPELETPSYAAPQEICAMGKRHIRGTVMAVSGDDSFLMRDGSGRLHRVQFAGGQHPPRFNDTVVVGGTVQTDFYLVNLSHAIFKVTGHSDTPPEEPVHVTAAEILYNSRHEKQAMPKFYGRRIRLEGRVVRHRAISLDPAHISLDSDSLVVPVDIKAAGLNPSDFPEGSIVSATGICLMNVENWSSSMPFPKIGGFTVVAQIPEDVRLVANPPWWTPFRVMSAVAILLVTLVGIIFWNVTLNRQVRRRTMELVRARITRDRSEMKAYERTRLSVELHDSLSQNLAGLGCQLIATRQSLREGVSSAERHLDTAETMLTSTRAELKRCLFDLRNDTLGEKDFGKAILQTIDPIVGTAKVVVRFTVPRSRLDDSQAHAVLSIIRELTANAGRHGKATCVRIAGCMEGARIVFSVRDNGSGFDSSKCEGPIQGHFGLSGIHTRVKKMGGTFSIDSQPGKGTHAKVSFSI